MKWLGIFLIFALTGVSALACDPELQRFPRDCKIQDHFVLLRYRFYQLNIDINEIAEYRALRFFARPDWEKAIKSQTPIESIYKPAPDTWRVWDKAVRDLFPPSVDGKGRLYQHQIYSNNIAYFNQEVLKNQGYNVQDKNADRTEKPGDFRHPHDRGIGFCAANYEQFMSNKSDVEQSMIQEQIRWQNAMGATFAELVSVNNGPAPASASLVAPLSVYSKEGCRGLPNTISVSYVSSDEVVYFMEWLRIFMNANIILEKNNHAALSPIEFAALTQKYFVTIHPFADGNGRTSRILQDMILANSDLPFAPAGDLQDDVSSTFPKYLEENYSKTESMLGLLDQCLSEYQRNPSKSQHSERCSLVNN